MLIEDFRFFKKYFEHFLFMSSCFQRIFFALKSKGNPCRKGLGQGSQLINSLPYSLLNTLFLFAALNCETEALSFQ